MSSKKEMVDLMRERMTRGTICIDDELHFTYQIADIRYIEKEDETFRYEFRPNYSVMELLDCTLFQGIPGLDLSLRKECYVRENITPVFISERTPGENRENLWELLEEVGMDYLNRLEWLIRTDTRYAGDHMYVIRATETELHAEKEISSPHITDFGSRMLSTTRKLLEIICSGAICNSEEAYISDENRKQYYDLLMALYRKDQAYQKDQRQIGIQRGVVNKHYKGRKKIVVEDCALKEAFKKYENKELNSREAAETVGLSQATFLRRYKERKVF